MTLRPGEASSGGLSEGLVQMTGVGENGEGGGPYLNSPYPREGIARHDHHWHSALQRPKVGSGQVPRFQFVLSLVSLLK